MENSNQQAWRSIDELLDEVEEHKTDAEREAERRYKEDFEPSEKTN